MLVLTRKSDEAIIIGDDIIVTVVEVRGDKVRLGITAPRAISVHRDEVYRLIHGGQALAEESCGSSDSPNPQSEGASDGDQEGEHSPGR